MTRKQRRRLAKVCNAKDLVCKTCVSQNGNTCKICPIAHLIDNELHRINGTKGNDYTLSNDYASSNLTSDDFAAFVDELEASFKEDK